MTSVSVCKLFCYTVNYYSGVKSHFQFGTDRPLYSTFFIVCVLVKSPSFEDICVRKEMMLVKTS